MFVTQSVEHYRAWEVATPHPSRWLSGLVFLAGALPEGSGVST
jgi:hypothetical protein